MILLLPVQGRCPREDVRRRIRGTEQAGGGREGSDAAFEMRGGVRLPFHLRHRAQPLLSQPS